MQNVKIRQFIIGCLPTVSIVKRLVCPDASGLMMWTQRMCQGIDFPHAAIWKCRLCMWIPSKNYCGPPGPTSTGWLRKNPKPIYAANPLTVYVSWMTNDHCTGHWPVSSMGDTAQTSQHRQVRCIKIRLTVYVYLNVTPYCGAGHLGFAVL